MSRLILALSQASNVLLKAPASDKTPLPVHYVSATWHVLKFYFEAILSFGAIHANLPSGQLLKDIDQLAPSATIAVGGEFAKSFNTKIEDLNEVMRRLQAVAGCNFQTILASSFAVRALWGAAVWIWGPSWALAGGLMQFMVAPMSFAVCIMRFCTNGTDCVFHYLLNACVLLTRFALQDWWPTLGVIRIDSRFTMAFLLVDFVLNLAVYLSVNESFGVLRLFKHIIYGTFNTKTYFVVVLGALCGLEYDLTVVLCTGVLTQLFVSFGGKVALLRALGLPCFPVLFYCEHRINHCPVIYQNAHKMHHYLHDTTAFDAHIYGSGMNEEFFWIMSETLPCLAFPGLLFPYFLNLDTLYASWTNKGAHSRTGNDGRDRWGDYDPDNWHADHHTLHNRNFGSSFLPFLDFYFGTQGPKWKGLWGKRYHITADPANEHQLLFSWTDGSAH